MSPGGANLLFDQIEIVKQPLGGRRNPPIRLDHCGQELAGFVEDSFVVRQSGQKTVGRAPRIQLVRSGKPPAVLLHLIGTEQFRTQWRLFIIARVAQAVST
ncbi:MAG TPA: hypothetical protein VEV20_04735 [Burkholderiales bacterium]|nr:hypothetical protein [Burkholderiales bacterium]